MKQCWPDSLTHTYGIRGRWVKSNADRKLKIIAKTKFCGYWSVHDINHCFPRTGIGTRDSAVWSDHIYNLPGPDFLELGCQTTNVLVSLLPLRWCRLWNKQAAKSPYYMKENTWFPVGNFTDHKQSISYHISCVYAGISHTFQQYLSEYCGLN